MEETDDSDDTDETDDSEETDEEVIPDESTNKTMHWIVSGSSTTDTNHLTK